MPSNPQDDKSSPASLDQKDSSLEVNLWLYVWEGGGERKVKERILANASLQIDGTIIRLARGSHGAPHAISGWAPKE